MTDPKMPYDVAKAVRAARQGMVEKLQLRVAHAHTGQFGNTGKSIEADIGGADYVETSIGSSPPNGPNRFLQRNARARF